MRNVYSIVMGRKGIIDTKKHDADSENSLTIKYKLSPAMLPISSFIVYYIHPTGEVIFSQLKVNFHQMLANYVSSNAEVFLT